MSVDISLEVWSGPGVTAYAFSETHVYAILKLAREAGCDLEGHHGRPASDLVAPLRAAVAEVINNWSRYVDLMSSSAYPLASYVQWLAELADEAERHSFAVVRVSR